MPYFLMHILHLLAAILFIGTVFFEVLILEFVRKPAGRYSMLKVESAIGQRARRLMPFVLLLLYGAGIGLAYPYRELLAHPFESRFGLLLSLKILLALSVLGHFLFAVVGSARGRLRSRHFKWIHLSLFAHMVGIVILAKAIFYFS